MGGNGPEHTFELRGAIDSETIIARLTLEAHHSQARRSVAHVHCACEFFFLDCGGSRGKIERRYRYVAP